MRMLSDRIKVEIIPEEELSKGGLYIAPNQVTGMRNNYYKGKVLKVGNGRTSKNGNVIPITVKEGDTIIYPIGPYKRYTDEEKDYHLIYETDVYAILD